MALIFDHAVKYGGKYYPANTPIEEKAPQKAAKGAEKPATAPGKGESAAKPETAAKAAKGRKKGDA